MVLSWINKTTEKGIGSYEDQSPRTGSDSDSLCDLGYLYGKGRCNLAPYLAEVTNSNDEMAAWASAIQVNTLGFAMACLA